MEYKFIVLFQRHLFKPDTGFNALHEENCLRKKCGYNSTFMSSKVSVIIPVFNQERYVAQAITSACEQTYGNTEVIVVNDGSTDNSHQIITQLQSKYPVIRYIKGVNAGVSNARNTGIDLANGVYIAFLDADDFWDKQKIALMANYLDAHKEIGLVHSLVKVVDENGEETGEIFKGKEGFLFEDLVTFNGLGIPPPSNVMLRKEVLNVSGLFDPDLNTLEDQDLFIRIARHAKIGRINETLGYYRLHKGNTHQKAKDTVEGFLQLKDKLRTYGLSSRLVRKGKWKIYLLIAIVWRKSGKHQVKMLSYLIRAMLHSPLDFIRYFYLKIRK